MRQLHMIKRYSELKQSLDPRSTGWLSPEGKFYPLEDYSAHIELAKDIVDTLNIPKTSNSYNTLLENNWIRISGSSAFPPVVCFEFAGTAEDKKQVLKQAYKYYYGNIFVDKARKENLDDRVYFQGSIDDFWKWSGNKSVTSKKKKEMITRYSDIIKKKTPLYTPGEIDEDNPYSGMYAWLSGRGRHYLQENEKVPMPSETPEIFHTVWFHKGNKKKGTPWKEAWFTRQLEGAGISYSNEGGGNLHPAYLLAKKPYYIGSSFFEVSEKLKNELKAKGYDVIIGDNQANGDVAYVLNPSIIFDVLE